ncbi:gliding motility-associated C-terminal domain-containing protein [Arenibacter sp. F26102]|uniref:T9SS type B sorting domain-containing protein n=1 Tax=Arenibacter sp. F26102 TaxID=2926416 RepID=UPI001FF45981|nr:gliding motility-associated C-terminal domain-containing protein [Arenibacter sp. F26102]MCK0145294.1 gliding motility-associated C-terminal domain-containing protein [Arenibacter sp. F26102]
MKSKRTKTTLFSVLLFLLTTVTFAQGGKFTMSIYTGGGTPTVQTTADDGTTTLTATRSDGGNLNGVSSGFLDPGIMAGSNTYTVTFNTAINISSFQIGEFTNNSTGNPYVFTPNIGTPISIADNDGAIVGAIATFTPSDWSNVTSIVVSYSVNNYRVGIDNLVFAAVDPKVTSIIRQSPTNSPTNADTLSWDVTFDAAVSNVDATDFALSGTTATIASVTNPSGNVYRVTTSGGDLATLNATVTLGFSPGQDIQNSNGAALTNTTPTGTNDNTFVLDNQAPLITSITRQSPTNSPTNADALIWDVTFDSAVSNVTAADFLISGSTATITSVTNPSGNVYRVTTSGGDLATLNGTVILNFASGQDIADASSNLLTNMVPTGTNNDRYVIDNQAPTTPTVVAMITNETPIITGTNGSNTALPSGETMTVTINGATYNVVPNENGNWTLNTDSATPANGSLGTFVDGVSYEVVATVTDLVGLSATDSTTNEITIDYETPTGYTVVIDQNPITANNIDAISFTFTDAEVGATYKYTLSSTEGTETVTGSGTIASTTDQITGIDISGLAEGTITLSVTLTDTAGNIGDAATDTQLKNVIAPVITLTGANPQIIELGEGYIELGATTDEGSTVTIDDSAFLDAVGSYSISYNSVDSAGNIATEVTRTVNVVDSTFPVITLTGANPQIIELGAGYTELGATTDDGSTVVINDNAFIDAVGSYSITYNAMNASGNSATEVTRTVNVVDTTSPETPTISIAQNSISVDNQNSFSFSLTDAEVGATYGFTIADDNGASVTGSGDITSASQTFSGIDISDLQDGIVTITVNITDAAGNTSSAVVSVEKDTQDSAIMVPKGFSPNGDGINDSWVIENLDAFPNHIIKVYNRSGNEVFSATNYQNNWEGISNGKRVIGNNKRLPTGAYYYVIDTGSLEIGNKSGWIYINY